MVGVMDTRIPPEPDLFLPSPHLWPLCQPLMSCPLLSPPSSVISPSTQLKLGPSYEACSPPQTTHLCSTASPPKATGSPEACCRPPQWRRAALRGTTPPSAPLWCLHCRGLRPCFWPSPTLPNETSCFHIHLPKKIPP